MGEPKSHATATCLVKKITQELVATATPTYDNLGHIRQRLYLDTELNSCNDLPSSRVQ